ncbi:MAG: ribbon-helix-helix domain-containing protein [Bacteroidales bacterium]|nr:ribbon-helix-helix domain-containing protein [Bacteroidales bacterium]
MNTFTSTLPEDLFGQLGEAAKKLGIPRNRIIEKALRIYLDQLTRAEYARSFRNAGTDSDILSMAEEGMETYLKQLDDEAV